MHDEAFKDRAKELKKIVRAKKRELEKAPEGLLRISKSHGRVQYYHRASTSDHNGKYIPGREVSFIRKLGQKDYDEKVLDVADQEIMAIEKYLRKMPVLRAEEIYDHLDEERRALVLPIVETEEVLVRRWEEKAYETKGFWEGDPELHTGKGQRVRSKSEVLIGNELESRRIPYHYEEAVHLPGFDTVHPDFRVLNVRRRKAILWEHLGLMDDPYYAQKALRKILAYMENGYLLGDDLILTWETGEKPLTLKTIREMIDRHCV